MPEIRPAQADDADALSVLIRATVAQSNAADYPPAVLAQVIAAFSVEAVAAQIARRQVFVALDTGELCGTAALEGDQVRSVFVDPARQGQRIGQHLMAEVEAAARRAGVARLLVPASLTARGFYERLGYQLLSATQSGEERGWLLARDL